MRIKSPPAQRKAELREARLWFQKTVDVYTAQQKKGTLVPMYATDLVNTQKSIARVDREMAELRP